MPDEIPNPVVSEVSNHHPRDDVSLAYIQLCIAPASELPCLKAVKYHNTKHAEY